MLLKDADPNIAWAAGLFEGEGSIVDRGKFSIELVMHMTDRDVMQRFCSIVGCGNISRREMPEPTRKDMYEWWVGAKSDVTPLLLAFLPWFGIRRRERALRALGRLSLNRGPRDGTATHCDRGHEYGLPDNTYISPKTGKRRCKECVRMHSRSRYTGTSKVAA